MKFDIEGRIRNMRLPDGRTALLYSIYEAVMNGVQAIEEALIEAGVISMDYTLSKISETRARDHGYLFKIHASNLGALFPPSRRYALEGPADDGTEAQAHVARPGPARVVPPRGPDVPVAVQQDLDLRGGGGRGPAAEDDG